MLANWRYYLEVNVYDIYKPTVLLSALWPIRSGAVASFVQRMSWESVEIGKPHIGIKASANVGQHAPYSRWQIHVAARQAQQRRSFHFLMPWVPWVNRWEGHYCTICSPYLAIVIICNYLSSVCHCFDSNTWNSGSSVTTRTSLRMMLSTCQVVLCV